MNQLSFAFHQPSGWSPKAAGLKLLQISEIIRRQDGLGLADAAIYTALCWFAGKAGCYPSHESIADRAGVSIATVKRSLSKLRESGFVSWERQSGRRGNRYRFHRAEEFRSPCRPRGSNRLGSSHARKKIAQIEPYKSLKMSDKQEREEQEASPGGLAKQEACSPEPAGPVKEALEEAVGPGQSEEALGAMVGGR